MRISLISIGDELLKGATLNTNSAFIGRSLLELGVVVSRNLTVSDTTDALHHALDTLLPVSDIIITTGGLGPTTDDITKESIAAYFGLQLVCNPEQEERIKKLWKDIKLGTMPDKVLKQAYIPNGAEAIQNSVGTAPGIMICNENAESIKYIFMLPGPPAEMEPMMINEILPRLVKMCTANRLFPKVRVIAGLSESIVEERMTPLIQRYQDVSVAYCASSGEVRLFLTGRDRLSVEKMMQDVAELFQDNMLPEEVTSLVADIAQRLLKKELQMAVAESCTGGMIASTVTELPGASMVFKGGIVAYCNEAKQRLLNVKNSTIETHGAVSCECVSEMLEGVCTAFGTTAGIAVSGIAGPSGGTPEKPLGVVCIGVKIGEQRRIEEFRFCGGRNMVRKRSVSKAFNILRELLM